MRRDGLTVGTYNARGMRGKTPLVEEWILSTGIQVAAITETWLRPGDETPMISEHVSLPSVHQNGKGYGGVAICVHPLLPHKTVTQVANTMYQYIVVQTSGVLVGAVYISPTASRQQV